MSKIRFIIIALTVIFTFSVSMPRAEAMSPKGKAFMMMCAYGTVGGALLGFASMAFGTNTRAIAQGASLGLYAGIIFGSYVILTHKKPAPESEYEEGYEEDYPPEDEEQFGDDVPPEEAFHMPADFRYQFQVSASENLGDVEARRETITPPVYFNLVNISF